MTDIASEREAQGGKCDGDLEIEKCELVIDWIDQLVTAVVYFFSPAFQPARRVRHFIQTSPSPISILARSPLLNSTTNSA
jgi:hypothetical protein